MSIDEITKEAAGRIESECIAEQYDAPAEYDDLAAMAIIRAAINRAAPAIRAGERAKALRDAQTALKARAKRARGPMPDDSEACFASGLSSAAEHVGRLADEAEKETK